MDLILSVADQAERKEKNILNVFLLQKQLLCLEDKKLVLFAENKKQGTKRSELWCACKGKKVVVHTPLWCLCLVFVAAVGDRTAIPLRNPRAYRTWGIIAYPTIISGWTKISARGIRQR